MSTDSTQSQGGGATPQGSPTESSTGDTGNRQQSGNQSGQSRQSNRRGARVRTKTSTFKGATVDMNGHVFRCSTEESDRKEFAKTIENAILYTNVHISKAQDIVGIFSSKDFAIPSISKPQKTVLSEEDKKNDEEVAFVDALYKEQIRRYATCLDKQAANQRTLYSVMWGQCSATLQSKVQGVPSYQTMHSTCDLSTLLKEIRNMSYELDSSKNGYLVSYAAVSKVFSMRQSEDSSCASYFKNYEAILSILDHLGIQLGAEPTLIANAAKELGLGPVSTLSTTDHDKCKTTAMERFQSIIFFIPI